MVGSCGVANSLNLKKQLLVGEHESAQQVLVQQYAGEKLLLELQQGMLLHRTHRYQQSNLMLTAAQTIADELRGFSVSKGVGTLTVNDAVRDYPISDFEFVTTFCYQLINYLALGDSDAARVAALRIVDLALQEKEIDNGLGFAHYLAGLAFETLGENDNALIAYRNAIKAYEADAENGSDINPPQNLLQSYINLLAKNELSNELRTQQEKYAIYPQKDISEKASILLIRNSNFVSERLEHTTFVYSYEVAGDIAISTPYYPSLTSATRSNSAARPIKHHNINFQIISSFEQQQRASLKSMQAAITARAIARAVIKYKLQQKARQDNPTRGVLVNILNIATERADTRSWDLLPRSLQLARISIPLSDLKRFTEINNLKLKKVGDEKLNFYFSLTDSLND